MAKVLVIPDLHIPYHNPDFLDFIKGVKRKYKCDTIVNIGDFIDHHALSFHDSEPMLQGVTGEWKSVKEYAKEWYRAFPKLTLIQGNHDRIPARQLRKLGMEPSIFMKPLKEIYDMPDGWDIQDQIVIDGILYHHGESAGGVNGFRKDAEERMRPCVSGHNHSNFGVSYTATDQELVWGLAVGCGVDNKSMAFAYGRHFKKKPILGCGVVLDGLPLAIPMDLGSKIRRV